MTKQLQISNLLRASFFAVTLFLECAGGGRAQTPPVYLDAKAPVEQRVSDLLSRMTLDEKVAQMLGAWENRQFFKDPQALFIDGQGNFLPERAAVLNTPPAARPGTPTASPTSCAIIHHFSSQARRPRLAQMSQ